MHTWPRLASIPIRNRRRVKRQISWCAIGRSVDVEITMDRSDATVAGDLQRRLCESQWDLLEGWEAFVAAHPELRMSLLG